MRIAEGRRIIRANLKIKQFIFQDARIIERKGKMLFLRKFDQSILENEFS